MRSSRAHGRLICERGRRQLRKTMDQQHIRNFSIIAHVDHGKSTLADRFIQNCGALTEREMSEQVLDSMDLEREKGVTIKASAVRMTYEADDGQTYEMNLIDTPGHEAFTAMRARGAQVTDLAVLVVACSHDAGTGAAAPGAAPATAAGDDAIPVKVVIVTMFETGRDSGDEAGEFRRHDVPDRRRQPADP